MTSSHSVFRRSASAASASEALPAAIALFSSSFRAFRAGPAVWRSSGNAQVDEIKETQAALLRIRGGLSTFQIELSKLHGVDHREHFIKIAEEQELMKELDLDFTGEENALNAASGAVNEANENTGNNSAEERK